MVTVPTPEKREEITRVPFVHPEVGEMVAYLDTEGPIINVQVKPEESDMFCEFTLTPLEARELAESLRAIADEAQRAGWSRKMLADVRKHYLPDATDDEIRDRLDALTERLGERIHGFRGQLSSQAGRQLLAEDAAAAAGQASGALGEVVDQMARLGEVSVRLAEAQQAFTDLERLHRASIDNAGIRNK